jgi:hypothetical protein
LSADTDKAKTAVFKVRQNVLALMHGGRCRYVGHRLSAAPELANCCSIHLLTSLSWPPFEARLEI